MEQKLQSNRTQFTLQHFTLVNAMSLHLNLVEIALFLLLITPYRQLVKVKPSVACPEAPEWTNRRPTYTKSSFSNQSSPPTSLPNASSLQISEPKFTTQSQVD